MAVAATKHRVDVRSRRLTTFVSTAEGEAIAQRAAAAGLSMSAYLRAQALGAEADLSGDAAVPQTDRSVSRTGGDLDGAIADLAAALARMEV